MFLAGLSLPPAKLDLSQFFGCNLQKWTEAIRLGIAILNSGAMHVRDFWVRVIPHPSGAAILNSGVQWALNLRPAWRNEIMRMVSTFQKISKSAAMAARAHSLTFYVPARLIRCPHITDAGGFR